MTAPTHAPLARASTRRPEPEPVVPGREPVELSDRQVQVLCAIASGCTAAQAGHRLGLSPDTVKTHQRQASRLLGARSGTHAVVLAIASGHLVVDSEGRVSGRGQQTHTERCPRRGTRAMCGCTKRRQL